MADQMRKVVTVMGDRMLTDKVLKQENRLLSGARG